MTSLRARLFGVWMLSLAASVAMGVLLLQLYQLSNTSLVQRAQGELDRACDRIADRAAYYLAGWSGPQPAADDALFQRDLDQAAALALTQSPSLTGGILRSPADIVPATLPSTTALAALQAGDGTSTSLTASGTRTDIVLACRLPGPVADLAGWVAVEVEAAPGYRELLIGMGVLLALMLGLSGGLAWLVRSWARQVRRMEAALAQHDGDGLPPIAPTGEVELDRVAAALNSARARLLAAQEEAAQSAARAASAERMAALGRVAAGVAHEIRNPIAAMRLRAESALALDAEAQPDRAAMRGRTALETILTQVDRLDRLSGELLIMTQRRVPEPVGTVLSAFLEGFRADWPQAALVVSALVVSAPGGVGVFDAGMMRRAIDNLIQNAVRHAPAGSDITLSALVSGGVLRFEVGDDGPGVAAALRDTLFEPFVTSRADGTGLGLAIAREMVQAHGGRIFLADAARGARFVIELPQDAP